MEILKSDFEQKLPFIKKAILEADFIAIDAEFTGNYHSIKDRSCVCSSFHNQA